MAFFRLYPTIPAPTLVRGEGVYLRPADMRDYALGANLAGRRPNPHLVP
jgi:hypothetical protein